MHAPKKLVRKWRDGIPLTAESFARLGRVLSDAPPGDEALQLNDELMNAFVSMLNRASVGTYGFVLTSPIFTTLVKNDTSCEETLRRLLKAVPDDVDLLAQKQLLFVVNVPKTSTSSDHWYFVRTDKEHAYIASVDSCSGVHPEALVAVQRFLERLHHNPITGTCQSHVPALTEEWRSASLCPPITPRQPDAVSCGVFTLIGIWCCMSGVTLRSRLDVQSTNHWRDVIALCLYRGGLGF